MRARAVRHDGNDMVVIRLHLRLVRQQLSRRDCEPAPMAGRTCAAAARIAPSKAKGVVTTATVREPISRATW
eukprot:scaffold238545_cov30-Tisochrysis_lutea.AAC.3